MQTWSEATVHAKHIPPPSCHNHTDKYNHKSNSHKDGDANSKYNNNNTTNTTNNNNNNDNNDNKWEGKDLQD